MRLKLERAASSSTAPPSCAATSAGEASGRASEVERVLVVLLVLTRHASSKGSLECSSTPGRHASSEKLLASSSSAAGSSSASYGSSAYLGEGASSWHTTRSLCFEDADAASGGGGCRL